MTWAEFSKALLGRFGPTNYEDPVEALSRLKQTTTVASYQEAFEKISHQVDGLPETFLVGCFIEGLKEEIWLEVKLKTPRNLTEAIGMALLVEEKLNLQRRGSTSQRLLALTAPSRDVLEDEENLGENQEQMLGDSHAEISFQAISDQALVDRFGLVVEKDTPLKVVVGNREHVTCTGRVRALTIVIQGYVISTDFFVLPIAACPIVLEVQWLKTLGPVEMDYEQLTRGFHLAGSSHKLQERTPFPVRVLNQFATVFQNPATLPPKRFQDHGIPLIPGARPVNYLGHVISSDGVTVESDKVQAVSSWPTPTNAKAPLHTLVGKAQFQWDEPANQAFQNLNPISSLLPTVLEMCHSSPEGGHFGFHKTLAKICQRFKTDSMKPAGLLQPLPIPEQVWEDVSMDFVEGLPNSNGFTAVMVVVADSQNMLTLYPCDTRSLQSPSPESLCLILYDFMVFRPRCSSYHPQSDGQTEVVNCTMEQYLRCFARDKPKKWVEWMPWAEYNYNTSVHTSTKMTPFQVVYGRPPPKLLPYVPGTTNIQVVDEYLRDRDELLRHLRANLLATQHRMKIQADHHRRELEFEKGDLVFVKLQPYRQTSVATRVSNKLSPRFFGPYRILDKVGPVAYRVELPPGSLIHNVFHVSLLRRCVGSTTTPNPLTLDVSVLPSTSIQPECILDERVVQKGKYRPKTELLVKWLGRPREDATWETSRSTHIKAAPNVKEHVRTLKHESNVAGISEWKRAISVNRKFSELLIIEAEYGDQRILLHLPISSKVADIKKHIDDKYKLCSGCYILQFLDFEDKWIRLDDDGDWESCIISWRTA
ncbi:transposon ty3-G gag-pol polyprotein [Tanacetum coccineum]